MRSSTAGAGTPPSGGSSSSSSATASASPSSKSSSPGVGGADSNPQQYTPFSRFSFGFNNPKFSDHVLHLVTPQEIEPPSSSSIVKEEKDPQQCPSPKEKQATTQAEGLKLHVSTLLLASQSDFFASLFSNGMKESIQAETRVVLEEDEKEAFLDMIRFLYEGKFQNEQPSHLLYVLRVADKYAVECAIEESARLLKDLKDSSVDTCCMFLDLPDSLQHSDSFAALLQAAREQLAERFKDLDETWRSEEFDELSARGIAAVLGSDSLQVQSENTVFQALMRWVSKAPERRTCLEDLLPLVRLRYVTVNFLKDVVHNSPVCRGVAGFEEALFEAMTYHALDPTLRKLEESLCRPREGYREVAEGSFLSVVDSLSSLKKKGNRLSKKHYLAGYFFFLNAKVNQDNLSLFLMVDEVSTGLPRQYCIPVQYVFSIKNHETGCYDRKSSYQVIYRGGLSSSWGLANFLNLNDEKNQVYIRNDTIHLKAEIKVHFSLNTACVRQWYFRDSADGVIKLMN